MTEYKKKLIEVALPLQAINDASIHEKSVRHGHPSSLHLWWARRPLATARAVIFCQAVDDPSQHSDEFPTEEDQRLERQRLFQLLERLVQWDSTTDAEVLAEAQREMRRYLSPQSSSARSPHPGEVSAMPGFHDPFAGGGALPLEAQRLGLDSHASDLNPIAVLVNKAMIEFPPRFAGRKPVNPEVQRTAELLAKEWRGTAGLAEDVRYYSARLRAIGMERLGPLYPRAQVTDAMTSDRPKLRQYRDSELEVIAWIWARTVRTPNPAYEGVRVPLVSSFVLSAKRGKEAYLEPIVNGRSYHFVVRDGRPTDPDATVNGTKIARGSFACLLSGSPISGDYIKAEGKAGRLGATLLAIVANGGRGRVYLPAIDVHERIALSATPSWVPEGDVPARLSGGTCVPYGLRHWSDLYTPRQLTALSALSDAIGDVRQEAQADAERAGLDEGVSLADGGSGALAYGDAIATYLAFQIDQLSNHLSALCAWHVNNEQLKNTFARQSLPMVWDYAETNPFSSSTGSLTNLQERQVKGLHSLAPYGTGHAYQLDAAKQSISRGKLVSTDPPYYDNISYADLSDFFYVWLRHSMKDVFPELFSTLTVPKGAELVAAAYRHGSRHAAEVFFLDGMTEAMTRLAEECHPDYPITIFYAFKQTEAGPASGQASTGWDTFLEAILASGLAVTGTWPIRTEQTAALKTGVNALASSIVIVCRRQSQEAAPSTRREFVARLREELPAALAHLQQGNIAPVDLAQAAIGPGMAVFSRYSRIIEADGSRMSVRTALALINEALDEILAEQEGEFDSDTRWAIAWFEQFGRGSGDFGIADVLARAKNTSVDGLAEAGILESKAGKVRLPERAELIDDWDPSADARLTVWATAEHFLRRLDTGEAAAAELARRLGSYSEAARDLAYRLYLICERKKWAQEALAYNALVVAWPQIKRLAASEPAAPAPSQTSLGV